MPVLSSNLTSDQGKFIAGALVERSSLIHKLPQFCNTVPLEQGNGTTANFSKVNRTDVPVDKLVEGQTPAETTFSIGTQTITTDHWGLYIGLTDVSLVTTKHPMLNEAIDLVADAVSRTQDREIAEVLNAGTNVQYWDGTRANRGAITSGDTIKAGVFNKARADMNNDGATPREGDFFIMVVGPQVEADILAEAGTSGALKADTYQYADAQKGGKDLIRGVVGNWLGFKIVRSNFLPKFTRIATFTSITATTGGSLSGTVYYKVTRKSLSRGFEEDIHVEANTAMGANTRLAFVAPSTSGYVYNIYAGTSTGDANLTLQKENLAASATYNLDSVTTGGVNPPSTPDTGVTVHPCYIIASKAIDLVEQSGLTLKGYITPKGASDSDPIEQRRKVGSKWRQKAGIRNSFAFKRVELASSF